MIVDTHCHLNLVELNQDLQQVLLRAKDSDVGVMQTICTSFDEFASVIKIARMQDNLFCSVGLHPCSVAKDNMLNCVQIESLCKDSKVIGIGETGLDYYHDKSNVSLQKQSFVEHIRAAGATSLPVIIHTRDAESDTIDILRNCKKEFDFTGLIHCFTSDNLEFANECLDLGLYISISGIITFKNAEGIRSVIANVPHNRLLLETDSPYLAPVPHRGKKCEPSFTRVTAQYLASFLNMRYDEIADITTQNFYNLFPKARRI